MASTNSSIRLVGIGGCGSAIVEELLLDEEWENDCVVITTDHQTARLSSAQNVIKVEERVLESAINEPQTNQSKAELDEMGEIEVQIRQALRGTDVVVVSAGMGTGTSTLLGLLVTEIARNLGILVVAFVTTPFGFEGNHREQQAREAIEKLQSIAHATIVLSNRRLLRSLGPNARMTDAFNASVTVLKDAFRGIKNLIFQNGLINLDLADLYAALSKGGLAVIGRGEARGENKIETAIIRALSNPLLEARDLKEAQTLIVTLQVGTDFSVGNLEEMGTMLRNLFGGQADILLGVTLDFQLFNSVVATVLATGISAIGQTEHTDASPAKVAWRIRE